MDREEIRVSFFYDKFKRENQIFPSLSRYKKHQKVTFELYKRILLKFLTIYFYDVYFLNRPMYFFLGGNIRLNKCGNWIKKDWTKKGEGKLKKINQTIGLFWYNRPCFRFEYAIKIKKLTGSTNRLPKIEREWKESYSVDELPKIKELVNNGCFVTRKKI